MLLRIAKFFFQVSKVKCKSSHRINFALSNEVYVLYRRATLKYEWVLIFFENT